MSEGTKHDQGKEPISLISSKALLELTRVLEFGQKNMEEITGDKASNGAVVLMLL